MFNNNSTLRKRFEYFLSQSLSDGRLFTIEYFTKNEWQDENRGDVIFNSIWQTLQVQSSSYRTSQGHHQTRYWWWMSASSSSVVGSSTYLPDPRLLHSGAEYVSYSTGLLEKGWWIPEDPARFARRSWHLLRRECLWSSRTLPYLCLFWILPRILELKTNFVNIKYLCHVTRAGIVGMFKE